MPTELPLPCIVCGASLEPAFTGTGRAERQPAEAVMFHAYGQYGSTVFDPQDGTQLQINICDSCLLKHSDRVWHARYVRQPDLEVSGPWQPGESDGEHGNGLHSDVWIGLEQLAQGQRRRWEQKPDGHWGPVDPPTPES